VKFGKGLNALDDEVALKPPLSKALAPSFVEILKLSEWPFGAVQTNIPLPPDL
jgi:hypothetical protein